MPTLQERALQLYTSAPDPLLLDAIRVLSTPDDPHYETAAQLVCLLEDLDTPD